MTDEERPWGRRGRGRGRRRGWPLGLFLFQLIIAGFFAMYTPRGLTWPQVGLLAAGPLALAVLSRWPIPAALVTGGINVFYVVLGFPLPAILPSTFAGVIGPVARSRREAYQRFQQEERRRRAAEERREAADERVRIARELHDILAHSLSLITVRASVALEVMDDNPQEVRPALEAIKQASRDGLAEVRSVLAGLRPEGSGEPAPRTPVPDLSSLAELVRQAEAAGLAVRVEQVGRVGEVPPPVGRAAYRIVQEALTNVMRHSEARTATVVVQVGPRMVTVGVGDPGPPQRKPDGHEPGTGLAGMRERAGALGGTVCAEPDGVGFAVLAAFPASVASAASAERGTV
ncbi:MAG: sensor histidine kinase [Hamadaea sp.]|nr:sensor histidine kinase [Hamadaea sp.]